MCFVDPLSLCISFYFSLRLRRQRWFDRDTHTIWYKLCMGVCVWQKPSRQEQRNDDGGCAWNGKMARVLGASERSEYTPIIGRVGWWRREGLLLWRYSIAKQCYGWVVKPVCVRLCLYASVRSLKSAMAIVFPLLYTTMFMVHTRNTRKRNLWWTHKHKGSKRNGKHIYYIWMSMHEYWCAVASALLASDETKPKVNLQSLFDFETRF